MKVMNEWHGSRTHSGNWQRWAGYLRDIGWKGSKTFTIVLGEDMGMPSRLNVSFTSKAGESIAVSGEVRKMG